VVRLDKAERTAIDNLAGHLSLPASTLARAMLLREAQQQGFWPRKASSTKSEGAVLVSDLAGAFAE
jgi:hypothetical protein